MPPIANRARLCAAALALMGAAAPAQQAFDPVTFFTGPTQGQGTLKEMLGRTKRTATQSVGHVDPDGWLVLDQKVQVEGDPIRQRRWRLKQTKPGHYSGTLTDAASPVAIDVNGTSIHITYKMKNGIRVDQTLTALPGGRAIDNHSTFHKWGMRVATLTERIEKR